MDLGSGAGFIVLYQTILSTFAPSFNSQKLMLNVPTYYILV